MDAESYKATLSETLFQSAQNIRLGRRFPFEQDNTLKHTAKKTQWLWGKQSGYGENRVAIGKHSGYGENTVAMGKQLCQSSGDLNPIEHL